MGGPGAAARGTSDRATGARGTQHRVEGPPPASPGLPGGDRNAEDAWRWKVQGQVAIPEVLADALRTSLALDEELTRSDLGPAVSGEHIDHLIERVLRMAEFLATEQGRSDRDADGALLITDPLGGLAARSGPVRLVQLPTGEAIPVTDAARDAARRVWGPAEFPAKMARAQRDAYPDRPHDLSEIPPFLPGNLQWLVTLGTQRQAARAARGSGAGGAAPPVPAILVDRPPDKVPDEATARVAVDAAVAESRRRIQAALSARPGPATASSVQHAIETLSQLAYEDVVRVADPRRRVSPLVAGESLLERTEVILYHSVYSVVLGPDGVPFELGPDAATLLASPILVSPPGVQLQRVLMPEGLYVSAGADLQCRIDGTTITKLPAGGIGSFWEYGYGLRRPHDFHERIQRYLRDTDGHAAAVIARGASKPLPMTLDALQATLPRLVAAAVPYAVEEVGARLKYIVADPAAFLKQFAASLPRLIGEQIALFIAKKLAVKAVPILNLGSVVSSALDRAEVVRVRHAIACVQLATKGGTPDDLTVSARVLAKILAEQFEDFLMTLAVANGFRLVAAGGRGLGRGVRRRRRPPPPPPPPPGSGQGQGSTTRPAVPLTGQGFMQLDVTLTPAKEHSIGRPGHQAKVRSRRPDVLIGQVQDHHRDDVLKVILADPKHPLRPIVTGHPPDFIPPPYHPQNSELIDWVGFPPDWQSAHVKSKKTGDAEVLVFDTRYYNQLQSHTIESKGPGFAARLTDIVDVGGIAITRGAALDLADFGKLQGMSRREIEALPVLDL